MKRQVSVFLLLLTVCLVPGMAEAQTVTGTVQVMHTILMNVYTQMIVLCTPIAQICQGIAAFGTTFYIGVRVWKHIANAEPIDFFPLFRPFVITLLITIFPEVLGVINGLLDPTVTSTAALVQNTTNAVQAILAKEAMSVIDTSSNLLISPPGSSTNSQWGQYDQPTSTDSDSGGGIWSAIGSGFKMLAGGWISSIGFAFKFLLSVILEVLYFAAALCIDTIRTFHLVILAVLGPFAFAFSCFDGLQHSLTHWIAKYINIYLWLPIANLFGAILGLIQQNMLQFQATNGGLSMFSPTNLAYLIFLVIGVIGYTTIPGIANYIIHSHTANPISQKMQEMGKAVVGAAVTAATGGAGGAAMASGGAGASGGAAAASGAGAGASSPNQFSHDKIAG